MKIFISTMLLSFAALFGQERAMTLELAEKGFQERWSEFQGESKQFPLWSLDSKEEELKSRFDQIMRERWQVYFVNPEDFVNPDFGKPTAIGRFRACYETPASFKSWGSRYALPGSFSYNLASPDYNASIITLNGKRFLAMEAPTKENVSAFNAILKQYHVTDLVRLTPAASHNREDCFPYWEGHLDIDAKTGKKDRDR